MAEGRHGDGAGDHQDTGHRALRRDVHRHDAAEREAGGHEPVGQLGDRFDRALHEHLVADLLVREAHGGRVVVEGAAVVEVDHQHVMAVLAQPFGGVEDALADTEHGVEECDLGHGTTQASATDTREVRRPTGILDLELGPNTQQPHWPS